MKNIFAIALFLSVIVFSGCSGEGSVNASEPRIDQKGGSDLDFNGYDDYDDED